MEEKRLRFWPSVKVEIFRSFVEGLRRINNVVVYVRKGKYYLYDGQVLSIMTPRKQPTSVSPQELK